MTISLDVVPEQIRKRVGPEAPEASRMLLARAVLPMPPGDLFAVLGYLISVSTGEVLATAKKSLAEMPRGVLDGIIKSLKSPELLDFALRELIADDGYTHFVILNPLTPDSSVAWAASRVKGNLLELIGNNQERLVRTAAIAEAIYFNPDAPMALTTRVIETAVRNGVDLSHIRGFREIYESIFGREAARKLEKAPEEAALPPEEQALFVDLPEEEIAEKPGVDAELFTAVLEIATVDDSGLDAKAVEEDVASKRIGQKPLHAVVAEMNVPQKVRLALVGNKGARALLIKDAKAVVALAVLRSPQLTPAEVVQFAKNKALSDRVLAVICRNRDWTRSTSMQLTLIKHPKTPPTYTNRWVRALGARELKELSKSRDVPGHVARLAKNVIATREQHANK